MLHWSIDKDMNDLMEIMMEILFKIYTLFDSTMVKKILKMQMSVKLKCKWVQ